MRSIVVGMAVLVVNEHEYKIKPYTTDTSVLVYIGLPKVGLLLFKLSMHHAEHLTMITHTVPRMRVLQPCLVRPVAE